MRDSIDSFPERWKSILPSLGSQSFHYVSLGTGTGDKDVTIVKYLLGVSPDMHYFPVDMSPEMLTLGMQECGKQCDSLKKSQILPIQLDFSREKNIRSLRSLLDEILGDEPILFSLLGNTMANFDNDSKLLKTLAQLVRPQDRFLLEVAHTDSLDAEASDLAAKEYENSQAFQTFVLSSLMQNTDLAAHRSYLSFVGDVEDDRSLRIRVLYQNNRDVSIYFVAFPDDHPVEFPSGDTIRLYLTRKYTRPGIEALVKQSRLSLLHYDVGGKSEKERKGKEYQFGIQLVLLARQ